ncbi:MAG TPA: 1-acyl-sn-glycerol-3-phosphate acyltransferase [Polyangiaceae bacterium LLY-WYZ-14_1]|nr:1-acyl-sn-glycerol-3-phosphate acyltransferase [Polyangiaceae bacterium LLY-WYZ-14_1]
MMSLVDALAAAAGGPPLRLEDVRLRGWVLVDRPRDLRARRNGDRVALFDEEGRPVIEARVAPVGPRPEPLPEARGKVQPLPYAEGRLFHGPAFQVMTRWCLGPEGASATLDRSAVEAEVPVPTGSADPLLLDGGTHAIPHDRLDRWSADLSPERVAYPARIPRLDLFGPAPEGPVRVEARFTGAPAGPQFPTFRLQWSSGAAVWAEADLVEVALSKGRIGQATPASRRAFLEGRFADGVGLGRAEGDTTRLDPADVEASDWLPGTVRAVYGTTDPARIVALEHGARRHRLHPRDLDRKLPLTRDPLIVETEGRELVARWTGPSRLDLAPVEAFWTQRLDREGWPVEDLYYGLIERFVGRVVIEDPAALAAVSGRAAVFLANHQTMVESLLFSILASALIQRPTMTIAKAEHRTSWLGTLIAHCFAYPGVEDPEVITFFDRDDKASLPGLIASLAGGLAQNEKAVMVHIEGTRARQAVHRVEKMSGAFLDLALQTGAPVIPVRFVGGLPVEPLGARADFPVGMGRQDVWLGRPILPEALGALPYGPRKTQVLAALDALGGPREAETPLAPDPAFLARVRATQAALGVDEAHAVLLEVLLEVADGRGARSEATRRLVRAARSEAPLELADTPEDRWLRELARRLGLAQPQ